MQAFLLQTLLIPKIIIDAGFQSRLFSGSRANRLFPTQGRSRPSFLRGMISTCCERCFRTFLPTIRGCIRHIKTGLPLFKEARLRLHPLLLIRTNNLPQHHTLVYQTVARLHLITAIRTPIGRYLQPPGNPRPHSLPRRLATLHSPPIAVADQACIGSRIAPVHVREILTLTVWLQGMPPSVSP